MNNNNLSTSLFVKNLPVGTTDNDVRQVFQAAGAVAGYVSVRGQTAKVGVRSPQDAQRLVGQRALTFPTGSATVTYDTSNQHHHNQQHHNNQQHHHNQQHQQHHQQHHGYGQAPMANQFEGSMMGTRPPTRVRVTIENCQYPVDHRILSQVFSMVSRPMNVVCGPTGVNSAAGYVDFAQPQDALRAVTELNGQHIYPNSCLMSLSLEQSAPTMMNPFEGPSQYRGRGGAPQQQRGGRGGAPPGSPGYQPYDAAPTGDAPVVIVSNVPEDSCLQSLWVLLEVYGNVISLKRQFNNKTNIIATFQHLQDAKSAYFFMEGCPYFGQNLHLKHFAGYVERTRADWSQQGLPTDPATLAYSFADSHHRTRPNAAFNADRKYKPDRHLFIGNLNEAITDDTIREIFTNKGVAIHDYFRKAGNIAILSVESPAKAVEGLVALHGTQIGDRYIKITFSGFPPGSLPPGAKEGVAPPTTEIVESPQS